MLVQVCIRIVSFAGLMLAVSLSLPAISQTIYRCTDPQGSTVFSDKPCAADAEKVELKTRTPELSEAQQERRLQQRALSKALEEEQQIRTAQREEQRRQAAEAKVRCREARIELKEVQTATYLYDYDVNGQRRILSDAEHIEALRGAKEAVKRACS